MGFIQYRSIAPMIVISFAWAGSAGHKNSGVCPSTPSPEAVTQSIELQDVVFFLCLVSRRLYMQQLSHYFHCTPVFLLRKLQKARFTSLHSPVSLSINNLLRFLDDLFHNLLNLCLALLFCFCLPDFLNILNTILLTHIPELLHQPLSP